MQHDAAPVELATPVPRSPAERAGEFATLLAAHVEETQRTRRPAQAVMRALAAGAWGPGPAASLRRALQHGAQHGRVAGRCKPHHRLLQ